MPMPSWEGTSFTKMASWADPFSAHRGRWPSGQQRQRSTVEGDGRLHAPPRVASDQADSISASSLLGSLRSSPARAGQSYSPPHPAPRGQRRDGRTAQVVAVELGRPGTVRDSAGPERAKRPGPPFGHNSNYALRRHVVVLSVRDRPGCRGPQPPGFGGVHTESDAPAGQLGHVCGHAGGAREHEGLVTPLSQRPLSVTACEVQTRSAAQPHRLGLCGRSDFRTQCPA